MDALSFINSEDIRNHLKKLNYRFSPAETAWLIYQSCIHTFKEKKEAWLELIETTDDCDVSEYCKNGEKPIMLHSVVKKYINEAEEVVKDFNKEEPKGTCIYKYSVFDTVYCKWQEDETYYSDLNECLSGLSNGSVLDQLFVGIEDGIASNTGCIIEKDIDDFKYRIKKQFLNDSFEYYELEFDLHNNLIGVIHYFSREREFEMMGIFDAMKFKFPLPFEKGDIVSLPPVGNYICPKNYPFVLTDTEAWDEHESSITFCPRMFVKGISLKNNCEEYYDDYEEFILRNYMNLSYYKDEFEGMDCLLPALSDYIKRKITLTELLEKYKKESFENLMSARFIRIDQCYKDIKYSLITKK